VVLPESTAKKYFGDESAQSALGKTMNLQDIALVKVTGIIKDLPKNSHLQFWSYALSAQEFQFLKILTAIVEGIHYYVHDFKEFHSFTAYRLPVDRGLVPLVRPRANLYASEHIV